MPVTNNRRRQAVKCIAKLIKGITIIALTSPCGTFRSALCYRIRYDLQQRFRRDRDLSDKRPIMRGNQQHRGGYAGRKQPHRN
jgi:hypothetical protein